MSNTRIVLDKAFFDNVKTTLKSAELNLVDKKKESKYKNVLAQASTKLDTLNTELNGNLVTKLFVSHNTTANVTNLIAALAQVKQSLETSKKTRVAGPDLIANIDDHNAKLTTFLHQSHEDVLKVAEKKNQDLEKAHNEKLAAQAKKQQQIENEHKAKEERLKVLDQSNTQLQQHVKNLQSQVAQKDQVIAAHSQDVKPAEQLAANTAEYTKAIDTLNGEIEALKTDAQLQAEKYQADLKAKEAALQATHANVQEKVVTLSNQHQAELAAKVQQVVSVQNQAEQRVAEVKALHTSSLANHSAKLDEITAAHKAAVAKTEADFNAQLKAQQNASEASLAEFKAKYDKEVATLNHHVGAANDAHQAAATDLSKAKETLASKQAELDTLKSSHADEVNALKAQIDKLNEANQALIAKQPKPLVLTPQPFVPQVEAHKSTPSFLHNLFGKKEAEEPVSTVEHLAPVSPTASVVSVTAKVETAVQTDPEPAVALTSPRM